MSAVGFDLLRQPSAQAETALDLIFIEGLTGETIIGIHDSELRCPQPLVIDVVAGMARAQACTTDRIGDTIDYGVVRERLLRLLREHRLQLLEAFAAAVTDILIDEYGAEWVRVRVIKPRKFDDVQSVGVQIERTGAQRSPSPQARAAVLQLIGSGMVPGGR